MQSEAEEKHGHSVREDRQIAKEPTKQAHDTHKHIGEMQIVKQVEMTRQQMQHPPGKLPREQRGRKETSEFLSKQTKKTN